MRTRVMLFASLLSSILGATIGGFIGWSIGTVAGMNEEDFWFRCLVAGWVVGAIFGYIASSLLTRKSVPPVR